MSHSWEEGELRESSREASPVLYYQSSALSEVGYEARSADQSAAQTATPRHPAMRLFGAVMLPPFHPDDALSNPRTWIRTADMCMSEQPHSKSELIITLSSAMKGTAATWLARITHPALTWTQFKTLFAAEFIEVETPAATLFGQLCSVPKDGNYVTYATQILGVLDSCFQELNKEEIAISLVLAHLSKQDRRVEHLASTKDIRTRETLVRELRFLSNGKRRAAAPDSQPEAKRQRPFCAHCRISGHHFNECRSRGAPARSQKDRNRVPEMRRHQQFTNKPQEQNKAEIICFKCRQPGHYSTKCPQRRNPDSRDQSGKRVALCNVNPVGHLVHEGEFFTFLFDSGSECSLMTESIASKFEGERITETVNLYGLGEATVQSTIQVQSIVTIDGHSVKIVFHVVPDIFLKEPIIIGREIISNDLKFVVEKDRYTLIKSAEPIESSNSTGRVINQSFQRESIPECSNLGSLVPLTQLCSDAREEGATGSTVSPTVGLLSSVNSSSFNDSIVTDLPPNDRIKLFTILDNYKEFFIEGIPKSRVKTGEMIIRLKDPSVINFQRPYRLGDDRREAVRRLVNELLEGKVIRPSRSPYASPAFPVPKKTGGYRLCVDYRALNANTISEKFPLPLVQDQIARLANGKFYSSLDMASGYHQIPVHPDSIEKTSFITYHGTWEYLAVPFGLKNSGSVFQRAVLEALGDLAHEYVVVFIDDILIVSESPDQALERLDTVLRLLTNAGFSLNLSKCSFVVKRISYLGYEIDDGQVRPNPKKIESLTKLPPPKTLRSLRQFLGLASYFRQFIRNFAEMASPLFRLVKDANSLDAKIVKWLPEHEKIRQEIISRLTSSPVLTIFNPSLPIELHTDASASGYGGILLNVVDGKPRVIAYYSRRTTPTESKYHSYELETMAVVKSVQHFSSYLQGRQFKVVTDCQSLKATHTKKRPDSPCTAMVERSSQL
ncbi:hypothetical protein M8J77_011604 [Diaphorina citri]|nr:hypothetical protein M8J77_011604 [Diaphorina citri]